MREFLCAWRGVGTWDAKVVVEDGPSLSGGLPLEPQDRHVCWSDFERFAGRDSWIFSKRDGGIQTFGWLVAKRMGATRIHVLNDDCLPWQGIDPCAAHKANLSGMLIRWKSSLPDLRTRGVPYRSASQIGRRLRVGLSMGLWAGVPDLDAVTTLVDGCPDDYTPPLEVRVVGKGQYEPFCDMNFAVHAEVLPLLYCPLMGEGQRGGRFDDIFAGVVAKNCLDHLGLAMTVGLPIIRHARASSVWNNLVRESGFMELHEHLWPLVDDAELTAATPFDVALQMSDWLSAKSGTLPAEWMRDYVNTYGQALAKWAHLVERSWYPAAFAHHNIDAGCEVNP